MSSPIVADVHPGNRDLRRASNSLRGFGSKDVGTARHFFMISARSASTTVAPFLPSRMARTSSQRRSAIAIRRALSDTSTWSSPSLLIPHVGAAESTTFPGLTHDGVRTALLTCRPPPSPSSARTILARPITDLLEHIEVRLCSAKCLERLHRNVEHAAQLQAVLHPLLQPFVRN